MCLLLKSISQYGKGSSKITSTLTIEVDYDPKENEVLGVESVYVTDHKDFRQVDITYIASEHMEPVIDKIISETNWRELYHETAA